MERRCGLAGSPLAHLLGAVKAAPESCSAYSPYGHVCTCMGGRPRACACSTVVTCVHAHTCAADGHLAASPIHMLASGTRAHELHMAHALACVRLHAKSHWAQPERGGGRGHA